MGRDFDSSLYEQSWFCPLLSIILPCGQLATGTVGCVGTEHDMVTTD